jgi:hypothetical protein
VKEGKSTSYDFMGTDFESLERMLLSIGNQRVSYHEVFIQERTKMFFDIDFSNPPCEFSYEHIVSAITVTLRSYIECTYTVHVAGYKAKDSKKESYHIVVDISCDRETNRYVA